MRITDTLPIGEVFDNSVFFNFSERLSPYVRITCKWMILVKQIRELVFWIVVYESSRAEDFGFLGEACSKTTGVVASKWLHFARNKHLLSHP